MTDWKKLAEMTPEERWDFVTDCYFPNRETWFNTNLAALRDADRRAGEYKGWLDAEEEIGKIRHRSDLFPVLRSACAEELAAARRRRFPELESQP